MVYKIVSVICDDPEKGFNLAYVELQFQAGKWDADNFIKTEYNYSNEWNQYLSTVIALPLPEYINIHNKFGKFLSGAIKEFIEINSLEFRVQLIALKGFDIFENTELGNPGHVAALTGINVVADLKGIDMALGGHGNYSDMIAAKLLPDKELEIQLALLAVLRWREENNFLAENTGAQRNSISGAVWIGQEA